MLNIAASDINTSEQVGRLFAIDGEDKRCIGTLKVSWRIAAAVPERAFSDSPLLATAIDKSAPARRNGERYAIAFSESHGN